MKKKKLLKRIEELKSTLKNERKKYKDLLFEDDNEIIEVKRLEYKIKEDIEHCFFFGLTSGINTFTPLTNPIYLPDPILFKKYCKECKLKQELTPASEVISLDDNIFDIKARPQIEVKRFSNLVERI